jgi:pimeloyl-ACP methyl ester carboxylesterase
MRGLLRWIAALLAMAVVVVGGLILANRTPDTDPAAMRAKYGGPPSQFVRLDNGVTVHLRDEGPRDAPVIVLLHGSNADLHTWDPWTRLLAGQYRIVRFDQIGHGLTGAAPDGDYTPQAYVREVQAVADKLGLRRFVLAGNSMGGGIALNYALDHPDRLVGLVLIDAGGAPPMGKPRGNIGFTIARNPLLRALLGRVTPRGLIEKSLRQTVANEAIVTPAMVDRYWELLRFQGNREATYDRFSQPRRSVPREKLAELTVPTLILWGERDPLIPVEAAYWYARQIPASKLIVYPGIGHIPMEEAAERSASDLHAWLALIPNVGSGLRSPYVPANRVK